LEEINMKKWKILIAVVVLVLVAALMLGVYWLTRNGKHMLGSKDITVTVVYADGTDKVFTYHTDAQFLGTVLTESGVVVRISEVIAVAMEDAPGGAGGILHLLSEAGLNVEYMYACVGKLTGKALMVIRTDDLDLAADILHRAGYGDIDPAEVYRI
jgi:hypothetical protein